MHKTSSSPEELEVVLQGKIAPNSREVCPGTISKSSAPYSMIQFDILVKETTEECQGEWKEEIHISSGETKPFS